MIADLEAGPNASWIFFDTYDCLCDPDDVLSSLGAEVSFEIRAEATRGKHRRACNIRRFEPKLERGTIANIVDRNGKSYGFLKDDWGVSYYFTRKHSARFDDLRAGTRVRFAEMKIKADGGKYPIACAIEPME
ncbi:hypothetical protein MTX26_01725 [Bradyrhizobium sp. ISRA443]|uniref:hypothetical protein n=1 Tax=unclassified Bradyrhizobium TaxID=2631580 RepID=UPI00247A6C6D|nr:MULTISPECIES: hypothetical protein [unclassified Bradyrhizobium]WGR99618.1 hypothetical protein MTX23_01725 [Bradyrhizobium sp. ISRA436]WGS06508.1 hypothetical protein MTX18_01725 [Bradyrhizobium sp. ISRA437]WGS13392.1 hypothetical protein MTX26_01725 [Bradyrhizobium sp. ISRA443]